jgi:hypothetical protein
LETKIVKAEVRIQELGVSSTAGRIKQWQIQRQRDPVKYKMKHFTGQGKNRGKFEGKNKSGNTELHRGCTEYHREIKFKGTR